MQIIKESENYAVIRFNQNELEQSIALLTFAHEGYDEPLDAEMIRSSKEELAAIIEGFQGTDTSLVETAEEQTPEAVNSKDFVMQKYLPIAISNVLSAISQGLYEGYVTPEAVSLSKEAVDQLREAYNQLDKTLEN